MRILKFIGYLILIPLALQQCKKADSVEIVTIHDPNFLKSLLTAGIDSDGDGQISKTEAEGVITLRLPPSDIKDLSGIEAFTNLDTLVADVNPITNPKLGENLALRYLSLVGCSLETLDITKNENLEYLDCTGNIGLDNFLVSLDLRGNPLLEYLMCPGNELEALDLSHNPMLKKVLCQRNRIPELDISNNRALAELTCRNNWIESLDLSQNTSLVKMICCGNRLSTLDISNNRVLKTIGIDNMSTLGEVCVWTLPFPPDDVYVIMGFSPNVVFTKQCSEIKD